MDAEKNNSKVILLNGTSCAGKTATAEYLVKECQAHFNILAWDSFLETLPKNEPASEQDRKDLVQIFMAQACHQLDQGENVILDVVCVPVQTFQRLHDQFSNYKLLSVRLRADPEILVRRESVRADRKNGQAVAQHKKMYEDEPHQAGLYDLEFDSSRQNIATIGQKIMSAINPI